MSETDERKDQTQESAGTEASGASAGSPVCCSCGCTEDLEYGHDPFAEEIGHDDTPVWECVACRYQSAMDI